MGGRELGPVRHRQRRRVPGLGLFEVVEEFDRIELAAAFWFSFAGFALPHRPDDPEHDLDLSSYGLVAVDDDGHWEPKPVFAALGGLNQSRS